MGLGTVYLFVRVVGIFIRERRKVSRQSTYRAVRPHDREDPVHLEHLELTTQVHATLHSTVTLCPVVSVYRLPIRFDFVDCAMCAPHARGRVPRNCRCRRAGSASAVILIYSSFVGFTMLNRTLAARPRASGLALGLPSSIKSQIS